MSKREQYEKLRLQRTPLVAVDNFKPQDPSGSVPMAATDPLIPTQIMVTLDQLHPYDRNPRRTRNPKYDEIKDSIRAAGLDQHPPITRRPGEPHYIIRNGGNTRLQILNELWQETGDATYYRITCLFKPWTGEVDTLAGHLRENDQRGDISFIERALAVQDLQALLEAERGKALGQRELARALAEQGYKISNSHISRMQYALKHLLPAIPTTLNEGLGKHQVEALIRLRNACWQAYTQLGGEAVDELFDLAFVDGLAEFDIGVQAWNLPLVQDGLIIRLADLVNTDINRFALELDAALRKDRGGDGDEPAPAAPLPGPAASGGGNADRVPPVDSPAPGGATPPRPVPPSPTAPNRPAGDRAPRPAPVAAARPLGPQHPGPAPYGHDESGPEDGADRLPVLRLRLFTTAQELAQAFGFDHLVHYCEDFNGFLVDLPSEGLFAQDKSAAQLWWLLLSLSGQLSSTADGLPFWVVPQVLPAFTEQLNRLGDDLWGLCDKLCLAHTSIGNWPYHELLLFPGSLLVDSDPLLDDRFDTLVRDVRQCRRLRQLDPHDPVFGTAP